MTFKRMRKAQKEKLINKTVWFIESGDVFTGRIEEFFNSFCTFHNFGGLARRTNLQEDYEFFFTFKELSDHLFKNHTNMSKSSYLNLMDEE